MKNINTIAIINSKAPYSQTSGKDALDISLVFASFEQKVSLFFQGDGVFQLIKGQDGSVIGQKDYLKTFAAFEFYDIENIYICQKSLIERGLLNNFNVEQFLVLSRDDFATRLAFNKTILRF